MTQGLIIFIISLGTIGLVTVPGQVLSYSNLTGLVWPMHLSVLVLALVSSSMSNWHPHPHSFPEFPSLLEVLPTLSYLSYWPVSSLLDQSKGEKGSVYKI